MKLVAYLFVPVLVLSTCDRLNKASPSQEVHILIPRVCEYVTLNSEVDFINVIKLMILQ